MAQTKRFNGGITVSVILLGKKKQILEIGDNDVLVIPEGIIPGAFALMLRAEEETRVVFAQKNVGQENGGYEDNFSHMDIIGQQVISPPIEVARAGQSVWTLWHREKSNRVDCWLVGINGHLELFQVGIITHDNGQTFRLLGEVRWQGQIFRTDAGWLAAKPSDPKYGAILWNKNESRANIRENAEFQRLLEDAVLPRWNGFLDELAPPLGPIPNGTYARVDWYIPFAGQNGQGIAKNEAGKSFWIHGQDVAIPPDADGIKRLHHGDLISYILVHENWGTKAGPAKLLGVKKVQ